MIKTKVLNAAFHTLSHLSINSKSHGWHPRPLLTFSVPSSTVLAHTTVYICILHWHALVGRWFFGGWKSPGFIMSWFGHVVLPQTRTRILQETTIIWTSTDQGTYAQLSPKDGELVLQNGQKTDYAKCPALSHHIHFPTHPSALLLEGPSPILPGLASRAFLHFQNIPHLDPEGCPPLAAHTKQDRGFCHIPTQQMKNIYSLQPQNI